MTLNAQIAVRIYNINVVIALHGGSIDKTLTLPLKRLTSHPYLSIYICIYIYTLLVWVSVYLSVCLYPKNVKTAEPIRPKFGVEPHVAPGKVYE